VCSFRSSSRNSAPKERHDVAHYPKAEIFAGYSFSHTSFDTTGHNLNGWGASVSATGGRYIGLAGDFSGTYGSQTQTFAPPCPSPGCLPQTQTSRASAYHFLGGPRFTHRTQDGTLFAHVLFGLSNLRAAAPGNRTEFAMGFGGGVDVPLRKRLAFRVFQADYIPAKRSSTVGGGWDHDFRVQTGIVFTFGKR
jgi:hypothetical protein